MTTPTSDASGNPPMEEASTGAGGGMVDAAGGGPVEAGMVTASCAGKNYSLCLDFESGKVDAPWTAPTSNAKVEEMNAAHGKYAMHLSNLHSHPQLFLHAAQMPGIKDVLWGRYYLYMDPGAPSGHGAIVRTFDMQTNWYEVGFEHNAYLGNWHVLPGGVPERYMRSKFVIPQKAWACVEFEFDGATPDMAKVYHGTSLNVYDGNDAPYITDMWLDDIALDSKRVGCL
jgi:hypothetical protein